MRNQVGRCGRLGSLLLGAIAAPAAAVQAQQADEIVVTQERLNRDAVTDFVDDVTVDANGQIAMYRAPICPFVDGFVDAQNRKIEQRIRQVAQMVGVEVAQGKCSPNLVLMAASDGAATMRRLAREKPVLFQDIRPAEVRAMLRQEGPVWTWQTILESPADGRSSPSSSDYKTGSGGVQGVGGVGSSFEDNSSALRITTQSRVLKTTRSDLFASFMLIDFAAIEGLGPTQIADYAAIRTLARTRAMPSLRQRTMLRLFDIPPEWRAELDQLTVWDLAYLQALYKSSNRVSASLQKGAITTEMRRRLAARTVVPQPASRPRAAQN